jgi:hypothetical protein
MRRTPGSIFHTEYIGNLKSIVADKNQNYLVTFEVSNILG